MGTVGQQNQDQDGKTEVGASSPCHLEPRVTHPRGGAWLASGEGNQSPESSHWSLSWGLPQAPHTLCGTDVPQNFNDLSLTFLLCIPFSGSPGSLCFFSSTNTCDRDFPGGSVVKRLPAMQETWIRFLGQDDPLEKEMATHTSILAWEIPCKAIVHKRVRH